MIEGSVYCLADGLLIYSLLEGESLLAVVYSGF